MNPRGIIITPTFSIGKDDQVFEWTGLDPAYLRFCITYWDVIDCPEGIIGGAPLGKSDNDVQVLEREGVFRRTKGHFVKEENGQFLLSASFEHPEEFWSLAQLYTLKKYFKDEPEIAWTLGRPTKELIFPPSISKFFFIEPRNTHAQALKIDQRLSATQLDIGSSANIAIQNALPVPSQEIPIEEVLSFKRKRHAELLRFRHALDGLYLSLENSNDLLKAENYAVSEIDLALTDIHRVMDDGGIKKFISNIKSSFSIANFVKGIGVGITAAKVALPNVNLELPTIMSTIGLAAISAINISIDTSALKPKAIPPDRKDYAYLYYVEDKLQK